MTKLFICQRCGNITRIPATAFELCFFCNTLAKNKGHKGGRIKARINRGKKLLADVAAKLRENKQ